MQNHKQVSVPDWNGPDTVEGVQPLLKNIKAHLPELQALLQCCGNEAEDLHYRFYHQSLKVYGIQNLTLQIKAALEKLNPLPEKGLNPWFLEIVAQGTGKRFHLSHNRNWNTHTRPMMEAYYHAHYFLQMACKYGEELEIAPAMMPSGWAGVLYLYNLR